jgi:hypothetical protein
LPKTKSRSDSRLAYLGAARVDRFLIGDFSHVALGSPHDGAGMMQMRRRMAPPRKGQSCRAKPNGHSTNRCSLRPHATCRSLIRNGSTLRCSRSGRHRSLPRSKRSFCTWFRTSRISISSTCSCILEPPGSWAAITFLLQRPHTIAMASAIARSADRDGRSGAAPSQVRGFASSSRPRR